MSRPPSPRPRTRTVLLCTGLVLALAACGSTAGTPSPSVVPPSTGPVASPDPSISPDPSMAPGTALLLEVTAEGGFINPAATIAAPPQLVVDTDGRIFTPASPPDGAVTPLVPGIVVRDVGSPGAAQILDAIRAAGLDREESGGGIIADAGSTVFTVVIDGHTIVSRFAPVGGQPGLPGGTGGPVASGGVEPGASAFALLARLTDPSVTWGAASPTQSAYSPAGYRIFEAPAASGDTGSGGASAVWPLPTGLATFGVPAVPDFGIDGLRSGVVIGAEAATLAPVLAGAAAGTSFGSGGREYTLWVRPLFPDELGG